MSRLNVMAVEPKAYEAMFGLERYLASSPLPKPILELVKLRASQLNGCAFCVDMHAHDAKAAGETDERLFSVVVWREAPWFNAQERAALALTEEATRLGEHGVSDEVWEDAAAQFDEHALAALVMAIAVINAWNRFGVILRNEPGSLRKKAAPAHQ
ncbi:carboxymuconolactone decarboxylase family protein [Solihabitans fulvus]|uniref:Carboxymuconolactone decarboxylase family protein n=1 Tax=Solihabitans fulvus TaxID=1892852 RepID=A0A5B2X7Q4_9PSEU|nr:carboxymuconolactone decarboxylase family protein [Solihabitans fulvus]KAA2259548.1 carboxymuconolactone decarboxylase family protein [Solihabitans fulvus]